jgi:hypothetical protein
MVKGKCAKVCPPSTMVTIPRRRASSQMRFTGKICPVVYVMWQMWITFVRAVTAEKTRSYSVSIDGGGVGKLTSLSTTPSRRSRCRQAVIIRG